MNGYEQILVVVLATFLALFLLIGIILMLIFLKVIKSVKKFTDKAEMLVNKADSVSEVIRQAAAPMAVGRALGTITDILFNRKSKRK